MSEVSENRGPVNLRGGGKVRHTRGHAPRVSSRRIRRSGVFNRFFKQPEDTTPTVSEALGTIKFVVSFCAGVVAAFIILS